MSERLDDHGEVSADECAHFFLPQHCLETLLRLRLHLRVVVLNQLAIGVNQVNEARWRVFDRNTLSAGKSPQLVNGLDTLLPIVGVAAVDQRFHFLHQLTVYRLGDRCSTLVEGVLCAIKAR